MRNLVSNVKEERTKVEEAGEEGEEKQMLVKNASMFFLSFFLLSLCPGCVIIGMSGSNQLTGQLPFHRGASPRHISR